ncbi:MAG: MliC family protein [Alphaproteobacteria bacterium]|nr:MliC family protein [Alphaproteobacteria bacterium]
MKKLMPYALCLVPLFLGACREKPLETIDLMCGEVHVDARIYRDRIEAKMYEQDIEMKLSQSASGARYAGSTNDTRLVLWNKGEEWLLLSVTGNEEEVLVSCMKQ